MNLTELAQKAYQQAKDKGFWDADPNDAERIALIHAEISEAYEAYVLGEQRSRKIDAPAFVEELADTVIRILDLAGGRGWVLASSKEGTWRYASREAILLHMHLATSAALEALRRGGSAASHLADVIKIADNLCINNNWSLWDAVTKKMEYNLTRPHMHGKKF